VNQSQGRSAAAGSAEKALKPWGPGACSPRCQWESPPLRLSTSCGASAWSSELPPSCRRKAPPPPRTAKHGSSPSLPRTLDCAAQTRTVRHGPTSRSDGCKASITGSTPVAASDGLTCESSGSGWARPPATPRWRHAAAGGLRPASAEQGCASQGHVRAADCIWSHGEHLMHRDLAAGEVLR